MQLSGLRARARARASCRFNPIKIPLALFWAHSITVVLNSRILYTYQG